jgi:hypothetical protein
MTASPRQARRSRLDAAARTLLGGLVAVLLVGRPLANGVALADACAFWSLVLGVVVAPGLVLSRVWGPPAAGWAQLAGQGATVGLAVHGLSSFAALALGRPWIGEAAPVALAAVSLAAARVRGRREPRDDAAGVAAGAGLLALAAVVVVVQPLFGSRAFWLPIPADLLFHVANAAEVRHRWPLEDPRVAGLPLSYHVFCYALPASASRWTGLPVADTLLTLSALLWISVFVLQVFNAGCALFGDRRVGLLGAALAALHADPGRLLGLGVGAFSSNLATGIYRSPTTIVGFLFLLGMAVWLPRALSSAAFPAGGWALLGLLGAAAAATKPSVPVVAVAGLLVVVAWSLARGREPRRAILATLVLGVASAPAALAASTTSRAGDMFRLMPAAVAWQSAFVRQAEAALLDAPAPAVWHALARGVLLPLWALGYLGLAGVGAIACLGLRPFEWDAGRVWAAGVFLAGAALALALGAEGSSQLFFVYNGQLLLALFGAAGVLAALARTGSRTVLTALLGLLALPPLEHAGRAALDSVRGDLRRAWRDAPAAAEDYGRGLAWLRARAGGGVVFANPSLLLSAFAESRAFYETGYFTQRGHQERWRGNHEPFPERLELQQQLLFRPDAAVAQRVRAALAPGTPVRVVADAVRSDVVSGRVLVSIGELPSQRLLPESLFERELANRAMHVYRLKPAAAAGVRGEAGE